MSLKLNTKIENRTQKISTKLCKVTILNDKWSNNDKPKLNKAKHN